MWQSIYPEIKQSGGDILSVAVDFQGVEKVSKYVELAGAEFNTVVDASNVLGTVFGYKAVPNGCFIDGEGILRYRELSLPPGGIFDIRDSEVSATVFKFLNNDTDSLQPSTPTVSYGDYFSRGLSLYRSGDINGAKKVWNDGIAVEPDHWNMRKQLWAIEHPEHFYNGKVNYDWQEERKIEESQLIGND